MKNKATFEEFAENNLCNWSKCEYNKEHETFTENQCTLDFKTEEEDIIEKCPSAKEVYEDAVKAGYIKE